MKKQSQKKLPAAAKMNVIERAEKFQALKASGMKVRDIADQCGVCRESVYRWIQILKAPPERLSLIAGLDITESAARYLVKMPVESEMLEAVERIKAASSGGKRMSDRAALAMMKSLSNKGASTQDALGLSDRSAAFSISYDVEMIDLDSLIEHPHKRKFSVTGEVWNGFKKSISSWGIIEPLLVREFSSIRGKDAREISHQILSGHRRFHAARECGFSQVPCRVVKMNDVDALAFMASSNVHKETPGIVEEARMIRSLTQEHGMSTERICNLLSCDEVWVETRKKVFDFGPDLEKALSNKNESLRLTEGAFREVLKAPAPVRAKALEGVLIGVDHLEPLNADRAKIYIQSEFIPECEKEQKWYRDREKIKKEVEADLKKLCDGTNADIRISVLGWGKDLNGVPDLVEAKELVPAELLTKAAKVRHAWVWYAEKIGAPVYVLPPDDWNPEKRIVVSRKLIMESAAARYNNGLVWDIVPKGKKAERLQGR